MKRKCEACGRRAEYRIFVGLISWWLCKRCYDKEAV